MAYEVSHHGRQEDICEIERQVEQLRTGMLEAESGNRKLQQEIQNAKTSEGLAKVEARAARDELKNMRRGILKVQDEYNTLRALYDAVKVAIPPIPTHLSPLLERSLQVARLRSNPASAPPTCRWGEF